MLPRTVTTIPDCGEPSLDGLNVRPDLDDLPVLLTPQAQARTAANHLAKESPISSYQQP
jgi:hypothetical protein